ncbi:MAG: diguanylate cyclase [Helicobacteraceae bacterium]|jgi:diguanylate cyclase (GGDEF)-like protein|nr:diguanylate cyclase [Helicobacteraceae bacterium]
MKLKTRLSVFLALVLIILTALIIVAVSIGFRNFGIYSAKEKAYVASNLVRDGLTSHMVSGTMDKRHYFMEKIGATSDIKDLWIVRSQSVLEQYGAGFESNNTHDIIDSRVFETGKSVEILNESWDEVDLRITIPYIATPECMQCHIANRGDVLGVVNMRFDITNTRDVATRTIFWIAVISLVVLLVVILAANYYADEYLQLFESIMRSIKAAHDGDFTQQIMTKIKDEGGKLAHFLNSLTAHLNQVVSDIDKKISVLIGNVYDIHERNPLNRVGVIVDSLVDIYNFKKTIESDRDKDEIYSHLLMISQRIAGEGAECALFEMNAHKETPILVDSSRQGWFCEIKGDPLVCADCRALRSGSAVFSDEFSDICKYFKNSAEVFYACLPFRMTGEKTLLLTISVRTREEIEHIKAENFRLFNYFEAARPVLESRYLTQVLQESNLRDGLTGLYNRKFLDEFIEHITHQATRANAPYALLALDIDFFKMVNDAYGHDIGDVVLKGFAETLASSIREADVAVRQGGEEFLVLLFNADEENAMRIAEKIREKFASRSFAVQGGSIVKTVSIGVAMFPSDAEKMWRAIKFADIALYKAKNSGRNRVIRFTQDMVKDNGEEY